MVTKSIVHNTCNQYIVYCFTSFVECYHGFRMIIQLPQWHDSIGVLTLEFLSSTNWIKIITDKSWICNIGREFLFVL